jgi:hypothetical protein
VQIVVDLASSIKDLLGTVALTNRGQVGERGPVNRRSPSKSASFARYRFPPEVSPLPNSRLLPRPMSQS